MLLYKSLCFYFTFFFIFFYFFLFFFFYFFYFGERLKFFLFWFNRVAAVFKRNKSWQSVCRMIVHSELFSYDLKIFIFNFFFFCYETKLYIRERLQPRRPCSSVLFYFFFLFYIFFSVIFIFFLQFYFDVQIKF